MYSSCITSPKPRSMSRRNDRVVRLEDVLRALAQREPAHEREQPAHVDRPQVVVACERVRAQAEEAARLLAQLVDLRLLQRGERRRAATAWTSATTSASGSLAGATQAPRVAARRRHHARDRAVGRRRARTASPRSGTRERRATGGTARRSRARAARRRRAAAPRRGRRRGCRRARGSTAARSARRGDRRVGPVVLGQREHGEQIAARGAHAQQRALDREQRRRPRSRSRASSA